MLVKSSRNNSIIVTESICPILLEHVVNVNIQSPHPPFLVASRPAIL